MEITHPGLATLPSIPDWVGELFVLSQLLRMGLDAYLSLGKKKPTLIHIMHAERGIRVKVKTGRAYSSLVVDDITTSAAHFLAFVVYDDTFEDLSVLPKVFIVPSAELVGITRQLGERRRVIKGRLVKYKDNWSVLGRAL